MGPVLFWFVDNAMAVVFGYYIGNYISKGERKIVDELAGLDPKTKVIIAQRDAANKARRARELFEEWQATESEFL
jgi:hypothetical protein